MSNLESLVLKKIQKFANSLIQSLETERKLNELEKQGRTWNVVQMDGTILYRGIRNSEGNEDQRLPIQW